MVGKKREVICLEGIPVFPLSAEAEMTTARNKEPALMDNGEKKEEGASMWGCI